ncbi:MAG: UDP-glucose/GDP-mannose dehydrogenase family protein [candidate division KSB1 bacterium]|nr:UDP-glucose/GDP-mannose dehydrogenase family protein [candidate division KSB1 bacterium]MDZ7318964.1 UDP-glucose/GDP-mannose dehydrogenase family protein [candidate division KSB1 bacterium]MDZ7340575.1 UDP-glucose/GDP-mannose dehydrogenase family protein [candidate division KSB1 bacterium]
MRIAVVGTGYVGLVTGTCFAETGIDVTCVDVDAVKIENLKKGILPIYEPGLEEILERNMKKDRLRFTTAISEGIQNCDVVFIAVGTPPDEDGSADLTHVLTVASDIGKYMEHYLVVVTKSTVPVGTAKKVRATIEQELKQRGSQLTFDVVSNPEFLKEGDAINDFLKPDRIVVGVESPRGEEIMRGLYKPFVLNGHPIIVMDIPSAEMTKYAANAMLATRISFMNEIANLCEIVGADVNMVRLGIGSDPRIGHRFIYPGIGYGGSCFPKDVKALIKTAQDNNYHLRILTAVEEVNEHQKLLLYERVKSYFKNDLNGKTIALWGLSFKPETDDMREAPSLVIIEKLLQEGCHIKGYDPQARKEAQRILGNKIELADDLYGALIDADCLLLLTEWQEFRYPNFQVMAKLMKQPIIFDGRNIYDRHAMREKGFTYFCIGVKNCGL